jgi:PII-like signaling protein
VLVVKGACSGVVGDGHDRESKPCRLQHDGPVVVEVYIQA